MPPPRRLAASGSKAHRHTGTQAHRQAHRHTGKHTGTQAGTQAHTQAGTQARTQAHRKNDRIWTVGCPGALDNTDNALRQGLDNPPRTTRQKQEKPSSAGVDHCCFQYNVLNYVVEFPLNASKSTQTQKSQMANMFYSMSMPSLTLETIRKLFRNLFMIISRVILAMEIQ